MCCPQVQLSRTPVNLSPYGKGVLSLHMKAKPRGLLFCLLIHDQIPVSCYVFYMDPSLQVIVCGPEVSLSVFLEVDGVEPVISLGGYDQFPGNGCPCKNHHPD